MGKKLLNYLLTPFSITSRTKLDASCKNVLFEMLDNRLKPDISEIDERREPEIPIFESVPEGDLREDVLLAKLVGEIP
jgi:hypothetical protein